MIYLLIGTIVIIGILYKINQRLKVATQKKIYQQKIKEVIDFRNQKLDQFVVDHKNDVPESTQNLILKSSAQELLVLLSNKQITSEQIIITYGIRIADSGRLLNSVADVDLQAALLDAKLKDQERLTKQPNELGPLHGLPLTFKDHVCVKGLRDTFGSAKNLFQEPQETDCLYTEILRKKGVIPLAKSNIPQCCFALESGNNIYGNTKNPWDLTRTAGGSSGGEAALISSRCSVLGIGSDAAGSLRIPASFTGIYTFMPSTGRSSSYGTIFGNDKIYRFGMGTIGSALGPMARNTEDLKLILENSFGEFHKKDFYVNNEKFDQEAYDEVVSGKKKLKIGVISNDNFIEAALPIQNSIKEVAEKLKQQGHEVQDFQITDYREFYYVISHMLFTNGSGGFLLKTLDGDDPHPVVEILVKLHTLPHLIKILLRFALKLIGDKRAELISDLILPKLSAKHSQIAQNKEILKEQFNSEIRKHGFDVLLLPSCACVAPQLGLTGQAGPILNYSAIMNVLEYCGGTVPIRKVKSHEQIYQTQWSDRPAKIIQQIMKGTEGLPIGVQVAAPPMKEEVCLGVMKLIENEFKFYELK